MFMDPTLKLAKTCTWILCFSLPVVTLALSTWFHNLRTTAGSSFWRLCSAHALNHFQRGSTRFPSLSRLSRRFKRLEYLRMWYLSFWNIKHTHLTFILKTEQYVSTFLRISPQWLTELKRLWATSLTSRFLYAYVDSIVSSLPLRWVKSACVCIHNFL